MQKKEKNDSKITAAAVVTRAKPSSVPPCYLDQHKTPPPSYQLSQWMPIQGLDNPLKGPWRLFMSPHGQVAKAAF